MIRPAATTLATLALLSACTGTPPQAPAAPRGDAHAERVTPAQKPPLPKQPLPPGVTRNPDGSVTIREPRCPNCSPWGF